MIDVIVIDIRNTTYVDPFLADLFEDTTKKLFQSDKYCDTDMPLNFKAKLIQIFREDGTSKAIEELRTIDTEKFKVCIHTVNKVPSDVTFLTDFLKAVPFLKNITVYVEPDPITETIDPEICIPEGMIRADRVLNIVKGHINKRSSVFLSGKRFATLGVRKPQESSGELECAWWFKHYIDKISDCVSGRIMQVGGTCYLNSAINGLILGPTIRKICMSILKNSNIEKGWVKENIFGECLDVEKTFEYFFQILYTACCKKPQIPEVAGEYHLPDVDVVIGYAQKIFSGIGGQPVNALLKIMYMLQTYYGRKLYANVISGEHENFSDYSEGDLITLNYRTQSKVFESNIYKNMVAPDKKEFALEFGLISLGVSEGDKIVAGHTIVGIICDGIPRIYDSATNQTLVVDWTRFNERGVNNLITKWASEYHDLNFIGCYVEVALYVRKDIIEHFKRIDIAELCKF